MTHLTREATLVELGERGWPYRSSKNAAEIGVIIEDSNNINGGQSGCFKSQFR